MTAATIDRIMKAAADGDRAHVEDIVEALWEKAREAGMTDLLIDLWDADEITEDAVEFAVENNGAGDPREYVKK